MSASISRREFGMQAFAAANWPEFRGAGDSIARLRRLPLTWSDTQNVAWSVATPGYGQSSPTVWRDSVFLTSVEGPEKNQLVVFCLDLRTGDERWRKQYAASRTAKLGPMISKAAPTPCVDRDRLYVFFESGDLIALTHSGETVWTRNLSGEYGDFQGNHGLGSSPRLTSKGVVILAAHGGPCYLLAVDKATGRNHWRTDRELKTAWTRPCVARVGRREQILVSVNGRIESYDANTGDSVWFADGLKGNLLSSATVSGDVLVVGSSEKGNVVAIDLASGREKWRAPNATSYFGSPLIHLDRVWLAGKVGVGWCIDLKTGRELWTGRLAGECWSSPLGAADRVYFFGVNGVTEVFDAANPGRKLATNTLTNMERTYGVAAVERGFVLRSGQRAMKIHV